MTTDSKNQSTKKRQKDSRSRRPRTADERGVVLAVLDLFGGNLTRASRLTGIPVRTLFEWRQDDDNPEVADVRSEGRRMMLELLRNFLESLCVFVLLRANAASFKDLYLALGMTADKVEALMRIEEEAQRCSNCPFRESTSTHKG